MTVYPYTYIYKYIYIYISNLSVNKYKVDDINESMGQKFYKLEGRAKVVMIS